MNKTRVYQLAKELDLSNKELIDKLEHLDIKVHNHMGSLEEHEVNRVKDAIKTKEQQEKEAKTIVNVAIKQSVRHVSHGIHAPNEKEKSHEDEHKIEPKIELKVTVLEEAKRPSKTTSSKAKSTAVTQPSAKQDTLEKSKRIPAAKAAALKQEEKNNMVKAQPIEQNNDSQQSDVIVIEKDKAEITTQAVVEVAPPQVKEPKVPAKSLEKVETAKATKKSDEIEAAPTPKAKIAKKSSAVKEVLKAEGANNSVKEEPQSPANEVQPPKLEQIKTTADPSTPKPDYRIATQRAREAATNAQRAGSQQTGQRPDYRTASKDTQRPDFRAGAPRGDTAIDENPPLTKDGKPDYRTATRDALRVANQGQRSYGARSQGDNRTGGPSNYNRPAGGAPYGDRKPAYGNAGNKDRNFTPGAGRPKKPIGAAKSDVEIIPYADRASISGQDKNKKTVHDKKTTTEKSVDKRKKATAPPRTMQRTEVRRSKNYKKQKQKQSKEIETQLEEQQLIQIQEAESTIQVQGSMTVAALAIALDRPAADIILKLMNLGIMATINKDLELPTLEILAADFGYKIESIAAEVDEDIETIDFDDKPEDLVKRPPVVTVMGHVDHGKTSLLDAIRNTKITSGEAGGITQHIGASEVFLKDEKIVFLDTPGHEAFTTLRARGAKVTDIAILVVAADDGVMPQTQEAIDHALAAKVPIIIAINKIDKANANPDRVRQELSDYGLLVEDWGGDIVSCEVSALKGLGIDHLLEMVLLVAEIQDLKANPNRVANGTIIEAKVDKGRGTVATVIVQNGTLNNGDSIVVGHTYGKIKAMYGDNNKLLKEVLPSSAVEIVGLNEMPNAGDKFYVVSNEKIARTIADKRAILRREESMNITPNHVTLEDLFSQIQKGNIKDLNIIVKADVHGSVEALKSSLLKLSNEEVRINVIHASIGTITESDILLASASNAIIIGFNVRPISVVSQMADKEKVDIKTYRIIYEAMNDVEAAMKGMLDPIFKEVVIGKVEVRALFKVPNIGVIAGAYVLEGKVTRNSGLRLVREGIIIHEGKVSSLKRFKDDAKEVLTNFECGIGIENYNDLREGDIIESYINEEVKR